MLTVAKTAVGVIVGLTSVGNAPGSLTEGLADAGPDELDTTGDPSGGISVAGMEADTPGKLALVTGDGRVDDIDGDVVAPSTLSTGVDDTVVNGLGCSDEGMPVGVSIGEGLLLNDGNGSSTTDVLTEGVSVSPGLKTAVALWEVTPVPLGIGLTLLPPAESSEGAASTVLGLGCAKIGELLPLPVDTL